MILAPPERKAIMASKKGLKNIEKALKKGKLVVDVVSAFKIGINTAAPATVDSEGEESTQAGVVCDGRRGHRQLMPDDDKVEIAGTASSSSSSTTTISEEDVVVDRISPNTDRRNTNNAAYENVISVSPQPKTSPSTVAAESNKLSSANSNDNDNMLGIGSIILTVMAAYHVWTCRGSILSNQFPISVVSVFVGAAFLFGYNMGKRTFLVEEEDDDDEPGLILKDRPGEDMHAVEVGKRRKWWKPPPKHRTRQRKREKIASILSYRPRSKRELKEWEMTLRAPFTDGPLMDHLLKYSPDFGRYKTPRLKKSKDGLVEDDNAAADAAAHDDDETAERIIIDHAPLGKLELNYTRAEAFESHESFSHVVDPLCKLRGMDLFLTSNPQENIWRQPLLNECGLRDVPTFIANFLMPFGNITAYFTLPDWVDDLNNIPEEKNDDPPGVKAFKRFLIGDKDYRNARLKVIPYVVDGPLAIRLLKPKPIEVTIHGKRHPTIWTDVPQTIDPITRKSSRSILECDLDFVSDRQIRRILNMARPHIRRITIDVAFIISKPNHSEIEEPSACLGLWRVDKVDLERCAVFPETSIEETVRELSLIMSKLELTEADKKSAG